jgi:hypothetical protein
LSLVQKSLGVIPAEAGIQALQRFLDPGWSLPRTAIRGQGDGICEFCKRLR